MTVLILRFAGSLSLLMFINNNELFAAAQGCDFGPDALTLAIGRPVPQTSDVPFDDGSGVMVMQSRCYYTYVPDSCSFSQDDPVPVVFDMHGYTSCLLYSVGYTGRREQADKHCFVVVWPSGNNGLPGTLGTCFNLPGNMQAEDYGIPGARCPAAA